MTEAIYRPRIRMLKASPNIQLTYALRSDPAPLTVSISTSDPVEASLELVITNDTKAALAIAEIDISIDVGLQATDLVSQTTANSSMTVSGITGFTPRLGQCVHLHRFPRGLCDCARQHDTAHQHQHFVLAYSSGPQFRRSHAELSFRFLLPLRPRRRRGTNDAAAELVNVRLWRPDCRLTSGQWGLNHSRGVKTLFKFHRAVCRVETLPWFSLPRSWSFSASS